MLQPQIDPLTGQPIQAAPRDYYSGSIPQIATAYKNDPRTALASSMLAAGGSAAPVAGGGWGVPEGIARALQGIAGGYIQRKLGKQYGEREQGYTNDVQEAIARALGAQGNPAQSNFAMPQAPGMPGPGAPMQGGAAPAGMPPFNPASPPAQSSPVGGPQSAPGANFAPSPAMAPPAPAQPPVAALGAPPAPSIPAMPSAKELYYKGIVPNEGGTDANGNFRTSPKGAIGPGQIMPNTGPIAAKLAGVPYDANKLATDPTYNNMLGEAYYTDLLQKFGDPLKAAAAYNAGPGAPIGRWSRNADAKGIPFADAITYPETKAYVQNFAAKVGASGANAGGASAPIPGVPPVQPPQLEQVPNAPSTPSRPVAPPLPPEQQSAHLRTAQALLQSGNPDLVAMAQDYLDKGLGETQDASTLRSQQQFARDEAGYTGDISNYNQASQDQRQDAYAERSATIASNRGRENAATMQGYKLQDTDLANKAEQYKLGFQRDTDLMQHQMDNNAKIQEDLAKVDASKAAAADKAKERQAMIMSTPRGMQISTDSLNAINTYGSAIASLDRFEAYMKKAPTGSPLARPMTRFLSGWTSAEQNDMNAITSDSAVKATTALKGSISNKEDDLILAQQPSINKSIATNQAIINAQRNFYKRSIDFETHKLDAFKNMRAPEFASEWAAYSSANPLNKSTKSFDDWKSSLPKYDANGRPVK